MDTPPRPPDVRMTWANLLFLHWPVDPALMRAVVPDTLDLDLYDGKAWVALVPFRMQDSRFRGYPDLPGLANFYECNVRTYVRPRNSQVPADAGVWFFSLDAEKLLPVLGGRWLWSLNYVHSRFNITRTDDTTDYSCIRRTKPSQRCRISWTRGDIIPPSEIGSIEHFLTERYWLYTIRGGRVMRGRVAHDPWPLRSAEVERLEDTLVRAAGLEVSGEPLAWHSDSIEVSGWNLCEISRDQA